MNVHSTSMGVADIQKEVVVKGQKDKTSDWSKFQLLRRLHQAESITVAISVSIGIRVTKSI